MKIAILSTGPGNYSTQRLKEEAIKRGHQVEVIKYKDCYATIEQSNPVVRYNGQELTDFDAIIPRTRNQKLLVDMQRRNQILISDNPDLDQPHCYIPCQLNSMSRSKSFQLFQ